MPRGEGGPYLNRRGDSIHQIKLPAFVEADARSFLSSSGCGYVLVVGKKSFRRAAFTGEKEAFLAGQLSEEKRKVGCDGGREGVGNVVHVEAR